MNEKNSIIEDIEDRKIFVFADRLKLIRTKSGLTQQQLANELGVSVAALSYYETGRRVPDIMFLTKISEYFMIPAEYFLGFTNSIKKENVSISDKLGLSDKAIENIQRYIFDFYETEHDYYESSDILNRLLENDDFYSVLNLMTWTGYECCNYMPDEEYIYFIAMKKMLKVIQDTIENVPRLKDKVVRSILPDQKEREKYYKWLLEDFDKDSQALKEKYAEYKKNTEQHVSDTIARYKNAESIRLKSIEKLKEAESNGEHNSTEE